MLQDLLHVPRDFERRLGTAAKRTGEVVGCAIGVAMLLPAAQAYYLLAGVARSRLFQPLCAHAATEAFLWRICPSSVGIGFEEHPLLGNPQEDVNGTIHCHSGRI